MNASDARPAPSWSHSFALGCASWDALCAEASPSCTP